MIRQRKNRAYLQKSSFKIQNQLFIQGNVLKPPQNQQNKVFESGIFNKYFKLSINNKNPLTYASKSRSNSVVMNNKSALCIKGQNSTQMSFNKENNPGLEMDKSSVEPKIIMLQTTGNSMLSFKKYKRNKSKTVQKRPVSAVSTCRSSFQRDFMDGSISRILQQLNQNSEAKKVQQKISTSQALVLYSKVLRNQQNVSSRDFYKRKLKGSSCQRYNSLSIMTNKVKIESKDSMSKKKLDIREYLHKVRLTGGKNTAGGQGRKKSRKEEDFDLGGWDTVGEGEGF